MVVSFYKFADFPDHADLRKPLKELCERLEVLFWPQKESMVAYVESVIPWMKCLLLSKQMTV